MKNSSLRIRPHYLQWVLDGRKTIEVRVAYTWRRCPLEALLRVLREIHPPEKEAVGVLAIHIAPAHGAAPPARSAPSR